MLFFLDSRFVISISKVWFWTHSKHMIWFNNFDKRRIFYIGHTRKIPVKLVNLFFAPPTLHPYSNKGRPYTSKGKIFKIDCLNCSYPAPCTLIDDVIALSNNNLNIYTNGSWGCDNCIKQVVVHCTNLKVGNRQQMVYQETDHGPFGW